MDISPRDNFFRMVDGRSPVRLPFDLVLTPPLAGKIKQTYGVSDPEAVFPKDIGNVRPSWKVNREAWVEAYQALGFQFPPDYIVGEFGDVLAIPDEASMGDAVHMRQKCYPLATLEEVRQLEALPWPDLDDPSPFAPIPGQIEKIHAEGRVSCLIMVSTVFEDAWPLRGMDNLFADLIDEDPVGAWLLDWFTERSCRAVAAGARAGADVIRLGDDIGMQHSMMMHPDFWREHLKPRLKRVIDTAREHQTGRALIFYHSDGDIRAVLDDLLEIGVDILNPMQPECMPLEEVIPAYQDQAMFWGMVGTQTTMPFGSPEDVERVVSQLAEFARRGARVFAAPTHMLEPDVPIENIAAFHRAVSEIRL